MEIEAHIKTQEIDKPALLSHAACPSLPMRAVKESRRKLYHAQRCNLREYAHEETGHRSFRQYSFCSVYHCGSRKIRETLTTFYLNRRCLILPTTNTQRH